MVQVPHETPSFSAAQRFRIGLDLCFRTLVVLAVVIMVNYLAGRFFERRYLSSDSEIRLSSLTVSLLKSITNQVNVTLYFDRDSDYYSTIVDTLNQYHRINPNITISTVDYIRDASLAAAVKAKYQIPSALGGNDKDHVIFDCEGRHKVIPSSMLVDYTYTSKPTDNPAEREYEKHAVAFKGEQWFTSMLIAVLNDKPPNACFLMHHDEHPPNGGDDVTGYLNFKQLLEQNFIRPAALSLVGTNTVPDACHLLIIAGPKTTIPKEEVDKIQSYLTRGGRMLVLIYPGPSAPQTDLFRLLAQWGIAVGDSEIHDPDTTVNNYDLQVFNFAQHPMVSPMIGSRIHLMLPHPVQAVNPNSDPSPLKVTELAFATPGATVKDQPASPDKPYAVATAVEKGSVQAVINEQGNTRILVVGDSLFLGNKMIDSGGNRDFANLAINWLLERTQLLKGLGPKPVKEFRLLMSNSDRRRVSWIMLGAMPGGCLLLGGLVWFKRRK